MALWKTLHQKLKNERPNREKFRVFPPELRNCILNEKFNPKMTKISTLFLKIRAPSSNFQESAGETSPSSLSSYTPVVIRKYTIPLLIKFAIVKLKIDLFRVSMVFLKSALRWSYLLLILYSAPYIAHHN